MVEVRSGGNRGAADQGPLVITAVAALVVGAAVAAAVFLATGGGGPSPPATAKVHDFWIVIDPEVCGQSDCVCSTPDVLKVSRGDTVQWVNATSAEVTITPSTSGAYTGPNTGTVGNVAGVVVAGARRIVPVTVSSSLSVGDKIQLILSLKGNSSLCSGYHGPRMEIDN